MRLRHRTPLPRSRQSKNINYPFAGGEVRGEESFRGGEKLGGGGGANVAICFNFALGDAMSIALAHGVANVTDARGDWERMGIADAGRGAMGTTRALLVLTCFAVVLDGATCIAVAISTAPMLRGSARRY
jgi:hypothetical protein